MNNTIPNHIDNQELAQPGRKLDWITTPLSSVSGFLPKIAPVARMVGSRIAYATPSLARKIAVVRSSKETTCVPTAIRMFFYAVTGELLLSEETAKKICRVAAHGGTDTTHLNAAYVTKSLQKQWKGSQKTLSAIQDCLEWEDPKLLIPESKDNSSQMVPIVFAENHNHVILVFPIQDSKLWWVLDPYGFTYGASVDDLVLLGYVPKFVGLIHESLTTNIGAVFRKR